MTSDAPERIYLEPPGPTIDDCTWCEHNVYDPDKYGGVAATEYSRADIVNEAHMREMGDAGRQAAEMALLQEALNDAVELLDRLANWRASDLTETVTETRAFVDRIRKEMPHTG
jgi:hypothetical protein